MEVFKSSLELRKSLPDRGVYSKITIPAGTVVLELKGDVLEGEEIKEKYPKSDYDWMFQIGPNTMVSFSGDMDDYINHHCNPNCGFRIVGNRALIVSLYQINPGDQITVDYSTTSTDTKDTWKMDCNCGDYNCRKVISGFQYLPEGLQEYYIKLGVVPKYLRK